MKKRAGTLLLALLMVFAALPFMAHAADGVEINETNFPDPVFRNYVSSNFDLDGNYFLSDEEILAVKSIALYKSGITDLSGLEYFTSLTSLNCSVNQLTDLDVSNNIALDFLYCENNQLTSLDVSQNTALNSLYCESNQLTSLDVSKNTALEYLDCNKNQLTSLDVSNNIALEIFYCENNQLTSLDVSQNTALISLDFGKNQLTSLDVSKNTALESLDFENNQLTSLDVSKNTALSSLECYANQLTSLDVSNNRKLESLHCGINKLTSLNVSNNWELTSLVCYSNQIASLDLRRNGKLFSLDCYDNRLTSLDLYKIENVGFWGYQHSDSEVVKIADGWAVDFSKLVGEKNLYKVELKPEQGWQYNTVTGMAVCTGEDMPAELIYYYNGLCLPAGAMDITLKLFKNDVSQQCVVMKQGAEKAYLNGAVNPTTQYATGYAKMENTNGVMQLPLRYIAEVNGLTVNYDENTGKTKVINPTEGTYLLITPDSKTVTKHADDGTLISTSEAPLAFTIQNDVTMGPLRYICEALGLFVSYQGTSHGNYVVISTDSKTDIQALEKIEEAYQLGL